MLDLFEILQNRKFFDEKTGDWKRKAQSLTYLKAKEWILDPFILGLKREE